jgi:hypothetical protein
MGLVSSVAFLRQILQSCEKSSGCGADVPPYVVHIATRVPHPDGEVRSRRLHAGTYSVEVDIVAVFHAPKNNMLHAEAALEHSRYWMASRSSAKLITSPSVSLISK